MKPPVPIREVSRIEALRRYQILDTEAESGFDDITALAAFICDTPIALISLVDEDRQWFKSKVGLEATQTSRDVAFCAYSIVESEILIVPDACEDERFADNPLVTGHPNIRFYAGAPLVSSDGFALGTLCVIDRRARQPTPAQCEALAALSRQVMAQMELRRISAELAQALASLKTLEGIIPICSYCKGIRDDVGVWQQLEAYVRDHSEAEFSHGICPTCMATHHPDVNLENS